MDTRKNVLICEDDPVQLRVLTAAFMQAGYRALGARSPAEAVRKIDLGGIDAVVADVQLEGGSAFDVLGNLRRIGLDAPVFMASAYVTPNLKERARAAGVTRFFEKPCSVMEIVRTVGRAVRERIAGKPGGRVLVVEDHAPSRTIVSEILGEEGFEVLVAEDGRRALETLRAARKAVDLVVLDLNVPGPSGAGLVRALRSIDPGIGVVMVTGEASHDEILAAYEAGASSLLRKPFSEDGLLRFVRAHVGLARKRREAAEREAKEIARRTSGPWTRRAARATRGFLRKGWVAASGFATAALLLGALLAQATDPAGRIGEERRPGTAASSLAEPEQVRLQRQMVEQMKRFSDGYQQELRWYGIAPR